MKTTHIITLAGTLLTLTSCGSDTVVYHQAPPPKPVVTTRTVYRTAPTPATIPGQAYHLPDAGAPSSFRASGN